MHVHPRCAMSSIHTPNQLLSELNSASRLSTFATPSTFSESVPSLPSSTQPLFQPAYTPNHPHNTLTHTHTHHAYPSTQHHHSQPSTHTHPVTKYPVTPHTLTNTHTHTHNQPIAQPNQHQPPLTYTQPVEPGRTSNDLRRPLSSPLSSPSLQSGPTSNELRGPNHHMQPIFNLRNLFYLSPSACSPSLQHPPPSLQYPPPPPCPIS